MQQIDTPDGLFHDGSPSTGELGTIVSADWLNSVARELENVVTGLGGSLDPARNDQIKSLLVEKLASKHNAVLTGTPVAPTAEAGTATDQLATTGFVSKAIGKNTGLPLLFPLWCPNRAAIPAGYAPADGQALSRSLYPDAWAGIAAGNVPVATDAAWLATPTERGKFTAGDGAGTFRLPDYNGKSVGSLGAVFMRGDGALSAQTDGGIQPDELREHSHPLIGNLVLAANPGTGAFSLNMGSSASRDSRFIVAAGGPETRPLNVTGCWVIRLFGAVVNPGAADAAQLATEVSKLGADKVALTAFLGANQSLATSGYQMLPGGLILQWGTTPVLSTTLTSVAFPIAFPSACRSVALTNSTGTNINVGATNITAAKFDGYASGGGNVHRYIAIGI